MGWFSPAGRAQNTPVMRRTERGRYRITLMLLLDRLTAYSAPEKPGYRLSETPVDAPCYAVPKQGLGVAQLV